MQGELHEGMRLERESGVLYELVDTDAARLLATEKYRVPRTIYRPAS